MDTVHIYINPLNVLQLQYPADVCVNITVEGIEAEDETAGFAEKEVLQLLHSWCCQHRVSVHAQQARQLDDFILFDQLLLHTLGALDERAALTRAMLVIMSVPVSPPCLLKGCVQRVRVRPSLPSEHGGRSNDHRDTGQ